MLHKIGAHSTGLLAIYFPHRAACLCVRRLIPLHQIGTRFSTHEPAFFAGCQPFWHWSLPIANSRVDIELRNDVLPNILPVLVFA